MRAKQRFAAAGENAPRGAKSKIGAAVAILDGLSGGLTNETEKLPTADAFYPKLPPAFSQALQMMITQTIQALNPAEWLTEPDRVVQKWMDIHGLTTPNDVQEFFEQKLIESHPEYAHHSNTKNKK